MSFSSSDRKNKFILFFIKMNIDFRNQIIFKHLKKVLCNSKQKIPVFRNFTRKLYYSCLMVNINHLN